ADRLAPDGLKAGGAETPLDDVCETDAVAVLCVDYDDALRVQVVVDVVDDPPSLHLVVRNGAEEVPLPGAVQCQAREGGRARNVGEPPGAQRRRRDLDFLTT